MKVNVGDYVRTKKRTLQPPQIAKIMSMQKDSYYHNQYYIELDHNIIPYYNFHIYEEDIEKSSPNITDLIKEGDYVNGHLVIKRHNDLMLEDTFDLVEDEDIRSIVTKESFISMKYEVGE